LNTFRVENGYSRVVTLEGNLPAQKIISQVFQECNQKWRGIGEIPRSGWKLNDDYKEFDALELFNVEQVNPQESPLCIAGNILQGFKKPADCAAFRKLCTPEHPLGATMVSSEGACAAYYQYGPQ
jgi:hydrogenase expression/formation protein HypD